MTRFLNRVKEETGIAMVIVLFVGAALTVVASTAAFVTIQDFRAGGDDRRAAEALSYAESGVERLMLQIRRAGYNWHQLNEAGCSQPPISVPAGDLSGGGSYKVYLTVYDNRSGVSQADRLPDFGAWPAGSWNTANDTRPVCMLHNNPDPKVPQYFSISSTGSHPSASRVVRQIVKIGALGLPVGMYADAVDVQGGNPDAISISLVTPNGVTNRDKLEFSGSDPYYKLSDFWAGASSTTPAPAAVHARGTISCASQQCPGGVEHSPAMKLNCSANAADNGQSMWDQSGWDNANKFNGGSLAGLAPCAKWTGTPAGPPPYSHFSDADLQRARPAPQLSEDDYASLKSAAQASGLYCQIPDSGSWNCTTPSGAFTPANGGVIQSVPGVGNNFVAYFDFPVSGDPFSSSRTVTWKAAVSPCSYDPALNRAVVIVVLYGSLDLTGQDEINGAFFVPEGQAWLRGSGGLVKIHGTTIAKRIDIGGNAQIMLDSCWVDNMPGSFLRATPFSWSEVDR